MQWVKPAMTFAHTDYIPIFQLYYAFRVPMIAITVTITGMENVFPA
jgi:hypothetical protein